VTLLIIIARSTIQIFLVRASAVQPRQMPPTTGIDGATADPERAVTGGPPSRGPRRAPGRGSWGHAGDLSACV